jgi:hypothetical protein
MQRRRPSSSARRPFHTFTITLDEETPVIRRKSFPEGFGGLFGSPAHFGPDFIRFLRSNRGLFNLVYEWKGQPSHRLEAYDPSGPEFASFQRTYEGRPFEFQLCVSELLPTQLDHLLAKEPPVSWRRRVLQWVLGRKGKGCGS